MSFEEWKEVAEATSYLVSKDGLLYSKKKNRLMSKRICKKGYVSYHVTNNEGVPKRREAHRLVAMAYISNPNNFKIVNHIDSNPGNNDISNLEWCTSSHNNTHSVKRRMALGLKINSAKLDIEKILTILTFKDHTISNKRLAGEVGTHPSNLRYIWEGKTWGHVTSDIIKEMQPYQKEKYE